MASAIQMPKLSDTMTEGTIQKWLVKEGDQVSPGDPIAEVETDKATLEMEAYEGGTILKILVGDGQTAAVGAPIAVIGKPGEDWQAVVGGAAAPAPKAAPAPSRAAAPAAPAPAPAVPAAGKGKASAIQMPKLSDTMTEGTIQKWLVQEGDRVSAGDPIAEVETDKATLEMEAYEGGTILKILVPDGGTAPVGGVIAVIGEPGADWQAVVGGAAPAAKAEAAGGPAPAPAPAAPAPAPASAPAAVPAAAPGAPAGRRYARPWAPGEVLGVTFGFGHVLAPAVPPAPRRADGEKIRATPVARKLAAELGIDLSQVVGTGPGGRIVRADVEAARRAPAVSAAVAAAPAVAAPEGELLPMSQMRKAIARNMSLANQEIPQFYLTLDVDMGAAVQLRTQLKESGIAVSYNDLVLRAVALAATKFPRVQAQLQGDQVFIPAHVHLGVAVAVEDGLVTPVIRNAESLSLGAISRAARELAQKARDKRLKPEDYQGGTITVSNLGMYDIEHFYAIVNPPQASIVSVGKIRQEPVVVDGQIVVGHRMRIGYSGDHRIVNGAEGAQFLLEVKRVLENPMQLLVG